MVYYVVVEYYDYRKEVTLSVKKVFTELSQAKEYFKEHAETQGECETCLERKAEECEKCLVVSSEDDPVCNCDFTDSNEICDCYDNDARDRYIHPQGKVIFNAFSKEGLTLALFEVE